MAAAKIIQFKVPTNRARVVEVSGQQVYLKRFHCAFCRKNYQGMRVHVVRFWEESRDITTGAMTFTLNRIPICTTTPQTEDKEEMTGCFDMGLQHLFQRVKENRVAGSVRYEERESKKNGKMKKRARRASA